MQKFYSTNAVTENAKKAKEAADRLFPEEEWKMLEERIFISRRRPTSKIKTGYENEIRDAIIIRDLGGTVYLVPEIRNSDVNQFDAIVNGLEMEFKNQSGASILTLKNHFLRSREQAPNVFINLENSPLSKHKIISALIAARNSPEYIKKNKFTEGGIIILKIRGQENLSCMDIKKTGRFMRPMDWRGGMLPSQPR